MKGEDTMSKTSRVLLSGLLAAVLSTLLNFLTSDKTILFIGDFIIVFVSVMIFTYRKKN